MIYVQGVLKYYSITWPYAFYFPTLKGLHAFDFQLFVVAVRVTEPGIGMFKVFPLCCRNFFRLDFRKQGEKKVAESFD